MEDLKSMGLPRLVYVVVDRNIRYKKFHIKETVNLLRFEDSSTDTNLIYKKGGCVGRRGGGGEGG